MRPTLGSLERQLRQVRQQLAASAPRDDTLGSGDKYTEEEWVVVLPQILRQLDIVPEAFVDGLAKEIIAHRPTEDQVEEFVESYLVRCVPDLAQEDANNLWDLPIEETACAQH
jgi:hypothetical protein